MDAHAPSRKRVRHFDDGATSRFLTFSTYRRQPLFTQLSDPPAAQIALDAIRRTTERLNWSVFGFVVMPEHVHLVVAPRRESDGEIAPLLSGIKRPSSYQIKKRLLEVDPEMVERLTVDERPGKRAFRFWQEGGGYDRNLTGPDQIREKLQYIHSNPVRRGRCSGEDDWPWSSAREWNDRMWTPPDWMPRIDRERFGL